MKITSLQTFEIVYDLDQIKMFFKGHIIELSLNKSFLKAERYYYQLLLAIIFGKNKLMAKVNVTERLLLGEVVLLSLQCHHGQ